MLHKVLATISSQTRPPDEIHLFLSKEGYLLDEGIREVPPELARLAVSQQIQVSYVANTGPYRKLLPLLKQRWQEDVCIVTIDDDTFYPPDFLERLVAAYETHRCIIAFAVKKIAWDSSGKIKPSRAWPIIHPPGDIDMRNFPIGKDGVLYRPEYFTKNVFDPKAIEICPYADDIWFRCNSWLNRVPVYALGAANFFTEIAEHRRYSLRRKWNISRNDHQLLAVSQYLGIQFKENTVSAVTSQSCRSAGKPVPDNNVDAGILYLSTGSSRHSLLLNAVESAKRTAPELPIHIISDRPLHLPFTWITPRPGLASRFYKTQVFSLSPFNLTLLLDDDTIIHSPLDDLASLLGDADVAMVTDPFVPTVGSVIDKVAKGQSVRNICKAELAMMAACGYANEVHYNSGVMIFRKHERTRLLFQTWFMEWCRYQATDQFALVRSIKSTGAKVCSLPPDYNRPLRMFSNNNARIVHGMFEKDKLVANYTRAYSLDQPKPDPVFVAFLDCVSSGLHSQNQYEIAGRIIKGLSDLKVVVFGCGHDSPFLAKLIHSCGGTAYFIEDQMKWIDFAEQRGIASIIRERYDSKVGEAATSWSSHGRVQELCDWANLIIVDGPTGAKPKDKGREIPIRLAASAKLKPLIIVYDYERPWERHCSDSYLGVPDYLIPGKEPHTHVMAIWARNRVAIAPLVC